MSRWPRVVSRGQEGSMNNPGAAFFVGAAIPLLLVALVYVRGALRRADVRRPAGALRHSAFAAGLGLLFLSVEWPFAVWAHDLFSVHQIGIMVARILSPMLIVMARPAGLLIAGLPRDIRLHLLKPGLSAEAVRKAWGVLSHPTATLVLYVATLYLWEMPALQALAVGEPPVGLAMHLSLLLVGLLFWGRVLERRPWPHGMTHGVRLMMIWFAILTQILLGAYITMKGTVLYHAYAATEQLARLPPIVDQAQGGFFLWIPSALLSLFALIVVVDMWGRHETRMDERRTRWSPSNSAILLYPQTAQALREMTRVKNRRLAIGMAGFALLIFSVACGIVAGAHRMNRRENIRIYQKSRQ
jgi:putative membrane protein